MISLYCISYSRDYSSLLTRFFYFYLKWNQSAEVNFIYIRNCIILENEYILVHQTGEDISSYISLLYEEKNIRTCKITSL